MLEMVEAFTGRAAYGPASALALGLKRMGPSLTMHGQLGSPTNHKLDLCTCNVQQIRVLLQAAWSLRVAEEVSHGTGLRHKLAPAPRLTDRLLHNLRSEQVSIIVRHITGSFSSNVTKHKWDPGISPKCDLPGARNEGAPISFTAQPRSMCEGPGAPTLTQHCPSIRIGCMALMQWNLG